MIAQVLTGMLATSMVAGLCLGGVSTPRETDATATQDAAVEEASPPLPQTDEATQSVDSAVEEATDEVTAERRRRLINDAVEALDETHNALKALDEGDTEAALESLAIATGKLDLVVSRNPRLALAPIDVRLVTHDLYATAESVQAAKKKALEHLQDGRLQDARALIEGLRSDVVVEVVNVPLATYPAAIKAITPLIDDDKIKEARASLQSAINTLVVTQNIHPLPIIRTEQMLSRAEELATTEERTDEQNEELDRLLEGSRRQLEFAQTLGYGEEDDFEGYYKQLDEIVRKTSDGKSGTGFFDKIRRALSSFGNSDSRAN